MNTLLVVFILLLMALDACTNLETREQRFADTREKAARGDVPALYSLGLMYEQGYGVGRNNCQAVLCFTKAAEKGHVEAKYHLGYLYHRPGMPRDLQQAAEWCAKAAEQGDVPAQTD